MPCLRRFAVPRPGPTLLFAAEDALHVVRERLEFIAKAAGIGLAGVPLHVITATSVRLDVEADRAGLREAVVRIRPRLLVLDPFVRLHRIDENVAGEVAPLLAWLRTLEREFESGVLLVHHARKRGGARAGQALRGSSELHAWGDSNLYLSRRGASLGLEIEHRAAASPPQLQIALTEAVGGLSMAVLDDVAVEEDACDARGRVLAALALEPTAVRELRRRCRMRMATLCDVLGALVAEGLALQDDGGYRRVAWGGRVSGFPPWGCTGNGNGKRACPAKRRSALLESNRPRDSRDDGAPTVLRPRAAIGPGLLPQRVGGRSHARKNSGAWGRAPRLTHGNPSNTVTTIPSDFATALIRGVGGG